MPFHGMTPSSRLACGGTSYIAAFWIVLGLASVLGTIAWGRMLPWLGILAFAIGPLASGLVSDTTGSVSAGLWLSPVLLIAAAVVVLFQRAR